MYAICYALPRLKKKYICSSVPYLTLAASSATSTPLGLPFTYYYAIQLGLQKPPLKLLLISVTSNTTVSKFNLITLEVRENIKPREQDTH